MPTANAAFWNAKLTRNTERDARQQAALTATGWRVLVIWECELRNPSDIKAKLLSFLGPSRGRLEE